MPHSTYLPASSSSSSTSSFLYYGHSLTLRISNGLLPFMYTYLYIRVGCKFRSFVKGRSTIVNEIIKKKNCLWSGSGNAQHEHDSKSCMLIE